MDLTFFDKKYSIMNIKIYFQFYATATILENLGKSMSMLK